MNLGQLPSSPVRLNLDKHINQNKTFIKNHAQNNSCHKISRKHSQLNKDKLKENFKSRKFDFVFMSIGVS